MINNQEKLFLMDTFFSDYKKMTQNQSINVALMSVGAFFIGLVPTVYATNFWYAVVSALIGVGVFVIYELLP